MKISVKVIKYYIRDKHNEDYYSYWMCKLIATYSPGRLTINELALLLNKYCAIKTYITNPDKLKKKLMQSVNFYTLYKYEGQLCIKIKSDQSLLQDIYPQKKIERDYIVINNKHLESLKSFKKGIIEGALKIYYFWALSTLSEYLHISLPYLKSLSSDVYKIKQYAVVRSNLSFKKAKQLVEFNYFYTKKKEYFCIRKDIDTGGFYVLKPIGVHIDRTGTFKHFLGRKLGPTQKREKIKVISEKIIKLKFSKVDEDLT